MNLLITRAFIKLRELLAANKDLARKIEQIEESQKHQARVQQQHASILVSVVQDIQKLKNRPTTRLRYGVKRTALAAPTGVSARQARVPAPRLIE